MKDDPREIDWLERQVKRIDEQLRLIRENIGMDDPEDEPLSRSILEVLDQLEVRASKTGDELKLIRRRFAKIQAHIGDLNDEMFVEDESNVVDELKRAFELIGELSRGIAQLAEQGNADRERVNGVWSAVADQKLRSDSITERIVGAEKWLTRLNGGVLGAREKARYTDQRRVSFEALMSETVASIKDRLSALEGYPRTEAATNDADFSPPIGGLEAGGRNVVEVKDRNYPGRSRTLAFAERRVRKYLTDRGYSDETVEELAACVRGESEH